MILGLEVIEALITERYAVVQTSSPVGSLNPKKKIPKIPVGVGREAHTTEKERNKIGETEGDFGSGFREKTHPPKKGRKAKLRFLAYPLRKKKREEERDKSVSA